MQKQLNGIRGIIFDLDGTLYVSPPFATLIQEAATDYIAGIRKIDPAEACELMAETRAFLIKDHDGIPTLSAVCCELGGNVRDLHAFFELHLQPEEYLSQDQRVVILLQQLAQKYSLYLFTNNNRALTTRIINHLGVSTLFQHVYTIDDTWIAKPDDRMLDRIFDETGLHPSQSLFVGDRYDVDLRLPEQRGCPVYLSQTVEQLLRLKELLEG